MMSYRQVAAPAWISSYFRRQTVRKWPQAVYFELLLRLPPFSPLQFVGEN